MMTRQIASLRRAANAAVEFLAGRPEMMRRTYVGVERKDALADAQAVKIIAAGVLAAAEAAIAEFQDPLPPEQHYHEAPRPRPFRDPPGRRPDSLILGGTADPNPQPEPAR